MGFNLGSLTVLYVVLRSWFGFMEECEAAEHAAEELALQQHLETLDEDELRQLLNE